MQAAQVGQVYVDKVVDQSDVDARNAAVHESAKHKNATEVVSLFQETFDKLEELVQELNVEELTDPAATAWFVVPRWKREQELWRCIANDSYEHHDQHKEDLKRLIAQE